MQTGACFHGAQCFFAHGEAELKQLPSKQGANPNAGGGLAPEPRCLCFKSFSGVRLWPVVCDGAADGDEDAAGRHAVRLGEASGAGTNQTATLLGSLGASPSPDCF